MVGALVKECRCATPCDTVCSESFLILVLLLYHMVLKNFLPRLWSMVIPDAIFCINISQTFLTILYLFL